MYRSYILFSSSHVQMWELDHKEGWAPKNWYFHTVVLEKTLESPLDFKEIKPVNPKGKESESEVAQSCLTLCNTMDCSPTRLLRPWDSSGKNTGVGCHFLLQGIFPTQGSNPGLQHCRQMLYPLSHQGSPNPKGNQPWIFIGRIDAEVPIFGHLMWRDDSLEKTLILGKIEGRRRRGRRGWDGWMHHRLDGHEFEQALGDGAGQGSLACCSV